MFEWLWKLLGLSKTEEKPANNVDTTATKLIHYRLNDPTTPKLTIDVAPPKMLSTMPIQVLGYIGGGYPVDTLESRAANDFVTIVNGVKFIQSCMAKPFKEWAATTRLSVNTQAGQDLNAYYDRRGLKFFYMPDRKLRKTVYAADSADVVAHELGHAILDALRPDLWSLQCLETMAFHEAYGDINAMLCQLAYPEVIDYMLKETGGNLRKSNIVSKLAEELGTALYDLAHYGKPGVLREAINSFVYSKPETLPQEGPDDQLNGECHSFGRLFMGAWYDMLVGVYEAELKKLGPVNALIRARDISGRYILAGAIAAPATTRFYDAIGRTMLSWGKLNGTPEYNAIIQKVLQDRKIVSPQIKMLKDVKFEALSILPDDQILHLGENKKAIKRKRTERVTLIHEMGLSAQENNPLFQAEVEIPRDSYLEFENGQLVDEIQDSRDDAIESARMSLVRLHTKGLVGSGDKAEFELREEGDKKVLVRTKFID